MTATASVLVPCPRKIDGKVVMPPEQVKVWTAGDRLGWVYHCPVCGEPHRETTATGNVILMIDAGCPVEEDWDDV